MRSTSVEGQASCGNGRLIKDAHDRSDQLFVELIDAATAGLPLMFALLEVMVRLRPAQARGLRVGGQAHGHAARASGEDVRDAEACRKMTESGPGQKRFRSGMSSSWTLAIISSCSQSPRIKGRGRTVERCLAR